MIHPRRSLLVLVVAVAALCAACPRWQRPECETRGAYDCHNDQPRYCAPTGHWTPIGSEPCARSGQVCAVDPADNTTHCAPAGGAR